MTDIVEDKKTWFTPLTRKLERTKDAVSEFFESRATSKTRLWFIVALVVLSGIGGSVVTYIRREPVYIEHKISIPGIIPGILESDTTLPPPKYIIQTWPARRPYAGTMAAANTQEVQSAMLDTMPADSPCFHAAALGEPLDIMIVVVNDTRFILRDVVNVEFLGTAKGAYYHSFVDQSKIVFEMLYPELRLHFLSVYVVGSSATDRGKRELVRSPYLVTSRNLAYCIQRFYKSRQK